MRKVYKYDLQPTGKPLQSAFSLGPVSEQITLGVPGGGELLDVQLQGGRIVLWAIIDPDAPVRPRIFRIAFTGAELPEDCNTLTYVKTLQSSAIVLHLFDITPPLLLSTPLDGSEPAAVTPAEITPEVITPAEVPPTGVTL
jgi:hypothetical protein